MATHVGNNMASMENWRLSKIEEELEKLEIHQGYPVSYSVKADVTREELREVRGTGGDQQIYSKVVIRPAYQNHSQGDETKEAVKKITEKYDSLGKVKTYPQENDVFKHDLNNTGLPYSTGSLGRRRDITTIAAAPPRDEYIHIAPEVVAEYPVPSAPMMNLHAQDRKLVDADILQTEMFYRSHKTDVFVCTCMVHMYFGTMSLSGSPIKSQPENWQYVKSGLLVLVVNTGEARSRDRRVAVVLAEKGTGFQIWKDQINKLTDYRAPSMGFHTMHLSTDHTRRVGFGYDDTVCASDFHRKLLSITTDPNNDDFLLLTGSKPKKKKKEDKQRGKHKYKAPSKSDISSPCCFTHITKLDRTDGISIVGPPPTSPPRDHRPRRLSPVKMTRVSSMLHHDT